MWGGIVKPRGEIGTAKKCSPEIKTPAEPSLYLPPERTSMDRPVRDKVFISYSHQDKKWLDELQTTLKPLVRAGDIVLWDDTTIPTGANWRKTIEQALETAKVGVMLVSSNFLGSDFITEVELPSLLKAAEENGLQVCWVLISHCLYEESQLAK